MTAGTPLDDLATTIKHHRKLAVQARADLVAATPVLVDAIRHQSGQSAKLESVLWSLWNDEHPVKLCGALTGLDTDITAAVITLLAARSYLGGDADELIRKIIEKSGSQPPHAREITTVVP